MDKYLLIPSVGKTFFDQKHLPIKMDTDFMRKPSYMSFGFHKTYVTSFDEIYSEKIHSTGEQENGKYSSAAKPTEFHHKNSHPNNKGSVDPSTWKENTNNTGNDDTAGKNTKTDDTRVNRNSNDGLVIESKIKRHAGLIIVCLLALILLVLIIKD